MSLWITKNSRMRRNIIYPGHSISVKRIFHMLTLCLIPITVFIQKVEGVLIEYVISTSKVVADAAPSANTISKSLTPVIPVLEALENNNGRELIEKLSIPTSQELKEKRRAFRQVAIYQDQSSSLMAWLCSRFPHRYYCMDVSEKYSIVSSYSLV